MGHPDSVGHPPSGLLTGSPAELAQQFAGLLWRDLMVSLLLGVAERPTAREIAVRVRDAAAAFLQLHPPPNEAERRRTGDGPNVPAVFRTNRDW